MSTPENTTSFEHRRSSDGEVVGTIVMTDDGLFVPVDRLGRVRSEPVDLDVAEATLDEVGIGFLSRPWLLTGEDGEQLVGIVEVHPDHVVVAPMLDDAAVAKAVDLTRRVAVPTPTDRLREA